METNMQPAPQAPQPAPAVPRLKSAYGVVLALLCAAAAEAILGPLLSDSVAPFTPFGRVAIVFLTLYSIHRFALGSLRTYRPVFKDLLTLGFILIGGLAIVWGGRILSIGLGHYSQTSAASPVLSPEALQFAIPYAAAALLIQAVLGLHYALVLTISFAVIVGAYSPDQIIFVPYVLATSLMGSLSLARCRSRSAYIKAGLNVSLLSIPFALAWVVMTGAADFTSVATPIVSAIIGGILCAFVASGTTPIIEAVGGYVTDMRLLEMATLDHPLLKELSINAPGTWNHSMVMGMMVEAAADAIGANAVLARTGAYFHDIGKMKKPLYFVENQSGGENRHDKLSSSMSALIIRSHVKDGIELAKQHKLPQAIVDMVPQHHGTSLIKYFYDKARKEAKELDEDAPPVDKSLYSYPGPKPQTKEAGILMLADGIEAATRTISDPTPDRIQGLVQKMINTVFSSGQLSECDLTLRDLHLIAKNFTRILSSIYHQRVAYAEPAEKGAEKPAQPKKAEKAEEEKQEPTPTTQPKKETQPEVRTDDKQNMDSGDTEQQSEQEDKSDGDSSDSKEDLKRLGI